MQAELPLGSFSVCGSPGDSCSHTMIPPWCPATLPSPRGVLSWLSSFSTSIPHVLKMGGIAKTPAVLLQKKQLLLFSSKRSSSCCSPSACLAVAVQLSPQAASQAVSRGNSRRVSSGARCLDQESCRHFICSQEGAAARWLRVPQGRSSLSGSS